LVRQRGAGRELGIYPSMFCAHTGDKHKAWLETL